MYPEKKGGSHKMDRPQQNWGLLTLLTRWASIWTMPNTASPKFEPPCGRAVYTPVRATILGHPPQKTAPGGMLQWMPLVFENSITNAAIISPRRQLVKDVIMQLVHFLFQKIKNYGPVLQMLISFNPGMD